MVMVILGELNPEQLRIKCPAQGHNPIPPGRFQLVTHLRSQVGTS